MTTAARYQMDDQTFQHLTAWCERFCRDDERYAVRERIITFLETSDLDDAEYSLSHGWRHIYDLVIDSGSAR